MISYLHSAKNLRGGNHLENVVVDFSNLLINADCQGAANIIKKVSTIFELVLDGVRRL
jgi:hypothetical protein